MENERKEFYNTMLKLAIPITLQNLILSSLNLVDNMIIGGLGDTAVAAVGLANRYFFLLNLLMFGVVSGSSIFTSQFWGKRDIPNIKKVVSISLITTCSASLIFFLGGVFVPEFVLGVFSRDKNVIVMGADYLKIISWSYGFTAISYAFSFNLRSIGNVKIPLLISVIALSINTVLNFGLVYGWMGMPKMGSNGSALGTAIARVVEMFLLVYYVYRHQLPIAVSIKGLLSVPVEFIRKFYKVTIPVILNEFIWALGVTMYSIAYARMSTQAVASTNISGTIESLMFVFFLGIGNACAVMIGNKIGHGETELAYIYAKRFIKLMTGMGAFVAISVLLITGPLLSIYKISPDVHEFAKFNLYVFAGFVMFKCLNYVNIVGILRSGGDTMFCLLLDTGSVWLIGVPAAFFCGLVLKLPVYWVYFFVCFEEVFKFVVGLPRVFSKKWINNLTVQHEPIAEVLEELDEDETL